MSQQRSGQQGSRLNKSISNAFRLYKGQKTGGDKVKELLGKYLETDGPISIGGHRGVGMNAEILYKEGEQYAIHDGFKYRENTIKSLKAASTAGASFVEFDIQVTRDGVPVCWHDDEVVLDQPFQRFKIADVDYNQLTNIGETVMDPKSSSKSHLQTLSRDLNNSSYALFNMGAIEEEGPKTIPEEGEEPLSGGPLRKEGSGGALRKEGSGGALIKEGSGGNLSKQGSGVRRLSRNVSLKKGSYLARKFATVEIEYQGPNIFINQVNPQKLVKASQSMQNLIEIQELTEKIRKTRLQNTYRRWECEQEDTPFPTLEEIFDAVPQECGFDVEIKAIDNPLQTVTPKSEIERLVNPTMEIIEKELKKVKRKIIVTSMDPDVCGYVKENWPQYKVGYISDCGCEGKHADERRNSIEKLLEVGKDLKLDIVVTDSRNVLDNKDFVEKANQIGLAVFTYGLKNLDPLFVRQQSYMGVQSACVDNIQRMIEDLTESGQAM